MRAIKLPEPPGGGSVTPEIFNRGSVIRRAVIIGNGAAGAEHQSIGLARALGLASSYTLYRVDRPTGTFNSWMRWLPLHIHKRLDRIIRLIKSELLRITPWRGQQQLSLKDATTSTLSNLVHDADPVKLASLAEEEIEKKGPLLVVASGRDTVPVAEQIKKLAPGSTFVVQIQHPRCSLKYFDVVVTPIHDYYTLSPAALEEVPRFLVPFLTPREPPNKSVVLTTGALHIADAATLRTAAEAWHSQLAPLPKPLLVVNVGGPTLHCKYGEDLALELVSKLKRISDTCGSIRISFSRRTPYRICDFIQKHLGANPKVYIWDGRDPNRGANPHLGHLAWADAFVVTADSISMISESCSTGKPVYAVGADRCTWKFRDFHRSLQYKGVVRNLTGSEDISESWSYPPLDDNALAAARIRAAVAERGWSF